MIILGIDPGIALIGWGVIDYTNQRCSIVAYGTLTTPSDMNTYNRLNIIYNDLLAVIEQYKPEQMAVEKLFFNTNAKTAFLVGQARGIILLAAAQKKLNISEFTPLQIKLSTVGYGKADKKQVQFMVQKILCLENIPKPDDAADALAVAITSAYSNKMITKIR